MKFRQLPPAAALLNWRDLWNGIVGAMRADRQLRMLSDDMRDHFGVNHVFLLSSGTAALALALMGLRACSTRTEVVIPAYTCYSVPAAVVKARLEPRLCDIDPVTFALDEGHLDAVVGPRTLCVVTHHLFGIPSDVHRIRELCRSRGAAVIEDAAQAMGGRSHGQLLGTLGDAGIFSFGRGKNVTSGKGGAILTKCEWLAAAIARRWRGIDAPSHAAVAAQLAQAALMTLFIRPRLYWIPAGVPVLGLGQTIFPADVPLSKLSGMQAGLMRNWRERLADSNAARQRTASDLQRRIGTVRPEPSLPYLRLPLLASNRAERDRLLDVSDRLGLGLSRAYPTAVSRIPQLRHQFDPSKYPAADYVAERILTLPTHHFVAARDAAALTAFLGSAHLSIRADALSLDLSKARPS